MYNLLSVTSTLKIVPPINLKDRTKSSLIKRIVADFYYRENIKAPILYGQPEMILI
jgi:hypothetical protein